MSFVAQTHLMFSVVSLLLLWQPIYYMAQSFEDAKLRMQQFSSSFARPFHVRYNPYTQVRVLRV